MKVWFKIWDFLSARPPEPNSTNRRMWEVMGRPDASTGGKHPIYGDRPRVAGPNVMPSRMTDAELREAVDRR